MLQILRSRRFVVSVNTGTTHRKILQVIFGRSDGSLFINFPYFKSSTGLVSIATLSKGSRHIPAVDLTPAGKVTSHLVKYSHHPDGRAHFSQAGKVRTEIVKQSIPLRSAEDHIFTCQIQGIDGFEQISQDEVNQKDSSERTLLRFNYLEVQPRAVKLVGRWYSESALSKRLSGNVQGPKAIGSAPDGRLIPGFLISSPSDFPLGKYLLFLTCELVPLLSPDGEPALTFIGGFDSSSTIDDLSVDTRFLALIYPTSEYETLKSKIGTIDL